MAESNNFYQYIGCSTSEIFCEGSPTLCNLLQNFVFYHNENRRTIHDSATLVINNAMPLWNKLNIETKRVDKCIESLKKWYNKYLEAIKRRNLTTEHQNAKLQVFLDKLNEEFDVRAAPVKTSPTSAQLETFDFVQSDSDVMQLEPVAGPSHQSQASSLPHNKRFRSSKIIASEKIKKIYKGPSNEEAFGIEASSSSSSSEQLDEMEKKWDFINGELVDTLDGIGLSDVKSIMVIKAVALALGHNLNDLIISRSTIRRARMKNRKETAERIKDNFTVSHY